MGTRKTSNILLNVLLSTSSLFFLWIFLELGIRIAGNMWMLENFSGVFNTTKPQADSLNQSDELLGWVPNRGLSLKDAKGNQVTILDDGIRSNGELHMASDIPKETSLVLAVGDSFTFGDGVSDHETWPAILEQNVNTRTLNAGVGGYGIDQTFLRGKALLERYHPEMIIFGFIPDDIGRCEFEIRGDVPKPYFDIRDDGELVLHTTSNQSESPRKQRFKVMREILGYSYFFHILLSRVHPEYWFGGQRVHQRGNEVSCLFINRFGNIANEKQIKVIVLAQHAKYPSSDEISRVEELLGLS